MDQAFGSGLFSVAGETVSAGPVFSAIICTLNRKDLLRRCIQHLRDQSLAREQYEILVIDNGSTDDTAEMVQTEFQNYPNLRYYFEPQPGLSQARNTAARLAKAPYLAYIDDDAWADPNWLEALGAVYQAHPQAWVVGGRVLLDWEKPAPDWLHPDLWGFLGWLEYGDQVSQVKPPNRLGGGNFAISIRALKTAGYFSTHLGRNQWSLLSNEETELMERVVRLGGECYFTPQATVHHLAPASRLELGFFSRRAYWQGYSERVQARLVADDGHTPDLEAIVFALIRLAFRFWAWLLLYPFSSAGGRVRRFCMVAAARGYLSATLKSFEGKQKSGREQI